MIDGREPGLQFLLERLQRLLNGCEQEGRARLLQDFLFLLPARIADQIVLEATKFVTVLDEHIPGFEGVAQQAIEQELITVNLQALFGYFLLSGLVFLSGLGGEEIPL